MFYRPKNTSLRNGVDRDVYQIVQRMELDPEGRRPPTVSTVYDTIKNSNSSLARQKKRLLEDSIERVLALRREETKNDEAEGDSDEQLERKTAALAAASARSTASQRERDGFLLNRQMTKHWDFTNASSSAAASAVSSPGTQPVSEPLPAGSIRAKTTAPQGTGPGAGATAETGNTMDADDSCANNVSSTAVERQPSGEPKPKRKKRLRTRDEDYIPAVAEPAAQLKLEDMGGIEPVLGALYPLVLLPLRRSDLFAKVGCTPQTAILLHGPSGTGKTALVHAIAEKLQVAFIPVSPTSLVSGISGESEKNIRDRFDEAIRLAPTLLFIDEIEAVAGKKDGAQKAMEVRMLSEISQGLDRIARVTAGSGRPVVVIAATDQPHVIEPTIRRRFQELEISMPDETARADILRSMLRPIAVDDDVDVSALAHLTPGYVGADLRKVVELAVLEAVQARDRHERSEMANADALPPEKPSDTWSLLAARAAEVTAPDSTAILQSGSNGVDVRVTFAHLKAAVAGVQPAAKREGFSAIPNTTWAQVGALQGVRRKLELAIVRPIEEPALFAQLGIAPAAGILLWGPPGCGKTLVAKAVANASKANFMSIKGPELLNKYVGESEYNVRQLFSRAKSSAPCILFFDEMDALAPKRDFGGNAATSRVVNALLTELDGVNDRSGIYVIGATNRPDEIDEAIRRPGRLGTDIYVGLPTRDDRVDILRTLYETTVPARPVPLDTIERVARDRRCDRFSGADLRQLLQVASEACIMRYTAGSADQPCLAEEDWEQALQQVKPSVKDVEKYLERVS